MGRYGYIETRPAEHGSCVTAGAQEALYHYLTDKAKLEIYTRDEQNPEYADHWEIPIPEKCVGRGKERKRVLDYEPLVKAAKRLKSRPGLVKDSYVGNPQGAFCARMLSEGIAAARKHKLLSIVIDWW